MNTQPHSSEAERAVLGAILLDPSMMAPALELVDVDDFFSSQHRLIMRAMLDLSARHSEIDSITVADELERAGLLEKVGGMSNLSALTDGVPIGSSASARQYASIVREKSRLRRLITIAEAMRTGAMAGSDRSQDIAELAVSELLAVTDMATGPAQSSTWRSAAESLLAMLESRNLLRIDTGLRGLDSITGGFLAGELVVFTAEVGAGKTLLAEQMRLHSCKRGLHGLFCSAEMTKEQLAAREVATAAGVMRYKMRFPEQLTREDWERLTREAVGQCSQCEILEGEITMPRVFAAAKRMRQQGNLSFVVVDYDELISAPGKDELERQAAVATACKSLAKSMAVPVVLISQLRKLLNGEDRRHPTLDRLYGAGAKRKHASTIIFVWRKYLETHAKEDESTSRLVVLKNRNGMQGAIPAYFDARLLQYRDLTDGEMAEMAPEPQRGRPAKPAERLPFNDQG